MYDIVIIGGGPAGDSFARLIGKRYKVLLLEKRSFDLNKTREKSCGGLIAPDAQLMLARFGLGIPKSVLISPQMFAVRTIDIENHIERYYQRHYINIDRQAFDQWLESLIPQEVKIINNAVYHSYRMENDEIVVKFFYQGKIYEEKTKLLAGADGAFSMLRNQAFPDSPKPKLYISIQEWFETHKNLDYYGAVFDREITDFYSWMIPKENTLILGTALEPGKQAGEKFQLLKNKLKNYGFQFEKSIKKNGACLFRPIHSKQICTGSQKIALLGEAAGFISPSSAEGLSYAFKSALALARSLEGGLEGFAGVYKKEAQSLMRNIFFKNLKSPAMYNRVLRKLILKSGVKSLKIEKMKI